MIKIRTEIRTEISEIPVFDIYPSEMNAYFYKKICTRITIIALFIIVKTVINPNVHLQINKQTGMVL